MGRVGTVAPAARSPSEALRVLDEAERSLDPASPLAPWVRAGHDRYRVQIRDGTVLGGLWIGPKDEAVGLAIWSEPSGAGRHVALALADGYRTGVAVSSFVRALDADAPIRSVNGPVPGVPDPEIGVALGPLGFTTVERVDMVFPDGTPTPPVAEVPGLPSRALHRGDAERLARLMERTYSDTPIDRWLFARSLDEEYGEAAIGELLGTGVGTWHPEASFGIEVGGRMVAATLVNDLEGPLLTEVMVDPSWRRRGLATRLIVRSIASVRAQRLGTLRLVVTVGNDRAEPLYRGLGFVATPLRGFDWLRLPVTGAAEGSSR